MQVLMGINALSPEPLTDRSDSSPPPSPSELAAPFAKLLSRPEWAFDTCASADCRLKLGGAKAYACLYKARLGSSGGVTAEAAREAERCALAQTGGLNDPRLVDAVQAAARRMFPVLRGPPPSVAPENGTGKGTIIGHEFDFPVYLATSLAAIRDGIRAGDRATAARVAGHAREFVAHNRLAIARHERTARSPLSDMVQELFDQSYDLTKRDGSGDDEAEAKLRVLEDRRRFDIVRFFQSECGFDSETWMPDSDSPRRLLNEPGTWIAVIARVRDHAVTILRSADGARRTQRTRILSSPLPIADLDRLLADWGVRRRGGAEDETSGSAKRLLQELFGGLVATEVLDRPKRLIIVPDAWAARIPFAALMLDDGRRLIDIASLVMVPSWDHGPWPRGKPKTAAVPSEPSRVLAGALDEPMMRREVADIRMSFPTDVLEASDFTFDRMLRQAARDRYAILHLSTHARFNSVSGGEIDFQGGSADAADLTALTGAAGGVKVTGRDASQPSLELLTLSACETGQGTEGTAGAEADGRELGLISVALRTGVRSSVGTLWRVDLEATAALMRLFYANLKNGLDKAESLRRAQMDIARLPGWSHPYYWAGFVLSGDWTRVVAPPPAGRP